jgi:hypothetical protein
MHGSRSKIPSKKSRPYIHDVKFLALLRAPYIYDISKLRVKRIKKGKAVPKNAVKAYRWSGGKAQLILNPSNRLR